MKFARRQRRALQTGYRTFRRHVIRAVPQRFRSGVAGWLEHFDLIVIDHGIFRLFYANRHKVTDRVWRSAQPSPGQIRRYARRGIRTIINLRGTRDCGSYRLERKACAKHGIEMIDFNLRSREPPSRETIYAAKKLFETVEYPILMHCKSGADRVGLMSALYLFLHEGQPLETAMRQLGLKYGHFKQADTGVLDYFFEKYREHNERTPTPFLEWVDKFYDHREMKKTFRANRGMNMLVNRLLRRE